MPYNAKMMTSPQKVHSDASFGGRSSGVDENARILSDRVGGLKWPKKTSHDIWTFPKQSRA